MKLREIEPAEVTDLWKLPDSWEWQRLGRVCQINPRRPQLDRKPELLTSFLPMSGVDDKEGVIAKLEVRPYQEVARGFTYFEECDVLFAKITPSMENGKCAIARGLIDGIGFGSTEFHVLRPGFSVTAEWIHKVVRRLSFRLEAKRTFRGAVGQQRVPSDFIESYLIPVPPTLDVQHRIVARIEALLAEVRESRNLLEQTRRDAEQIMEAALGEVIQKLDEQYPDSPTISELISSRQIKIDGGGTPSRSNESYWTGLIPWVSPKDMKRWYIEDAQEHISHTALQETAVKLIPEGSVLTVVRGMILAHTWPVGITQTKVTINQDMKALLPSGNFLPEYLGYILRARASSVLQQVETAAHGTRRLKTDTLMRVIVPALSKSDQVRVVEYFNSIQHEVDEILKLLDQDANLLDLLEQSILERAFRGEL